MLRPAVRAATQRATTSRSTALRQPISRRWASTVPADKSRSWKSSAFRWGLAGAIVYYYNTTNVFADERDAQYAYYSPPTPIESEEPRTLDSYTKRSKEQPTISPTQTPAATEGELATSASAGGPDALEGEAAQQGAFNEETGEINWDCPCLGGMAHGPCGDEFKAAFSCFVYSKEEPKGVECIEKFKGMQDCFRAHPDVYGAELDYDEEGEGEGEEVGTPALARDAPAEIGTSSLTSSSNAPALAQDGPVATESSKAGKSRPQVKALKTSSKADPSGSPSSSAKAVKDQAEADHTDTSESDSLVPKVAHDARDDN